MNAQQRKYLIDTMKAEADRKIHELKKKLKQPPSLANFLFKELMSGNLELQPHEVILDALKKRAETAAHDVNWLSGDRMGYEKNIVVKLDIPDLIVIPEEYRQIREQIAHDNKDINDQIESIQAQVKALELRINLATNDKLQKIISEVDDMGDLSLLDTKLKLPQG